MINEPVLHALIDNIQQGVAHRGLYRSQPKVIEDQQNGLCLMSFGTWARSRRPAVCAARPERFAAG